MLFLETIGLPFVCCVSMCYITCSSRPRMWFYVFGLHVFLFLQTPPRQARGLAQNDSVTVTPAFIATSSPTEISALTVRPTVTGLPPPPPPSIDPTKASASTARPTVIGLPPPPPPIIDPTKASAITTRPTVTGLPPPPPPIIDPTKGSTVTARPTVTGLILPPPPPPIIVPTKAASPTPASITLGFVPPPPPPAFTPSVVTASPSISTPVGFLPPPPPPGITLSVDQPLPINVFPFGAQVGHGNLSRTDDDCSERLDTDCNSVPVLGQFITNFYVCANGIITTNSSFRDYTPKLFPGIDSSRDRFLLAPFWVDVDIRRQGHVWYGSHRKNNDGDVTYKADKLVHELSPNNSDFMSEVVYVATWENVQNYPDGLWYTDEYSGLINTFQAVLITDFINTFMIYNYIDIQFSGRDSALVGYTTGDGVQFFNQPGSLTNAIRNVSQVKTGNYTGMLFFHLASASIVQATADSQCQKWYCEDKTHRFRDPSLWSSLLAPCPWTASHAAMDSRYIQRQCAAMKMKPA
ncbi:mucin-like protein [Corticium candelabrum]|uniref:mucin-like protein n=1 Tax=Corticium candelabrum TaxID=121492 RepID=UPI002E2671E3|nr:mucin-like protein [Corticium candelabrum]